MNKTLIILFSIALLLGACNRNTNDNPTPNTPQEMDDLKVADGFNWKTTADYQLTLKGKVNNIVDVVSEADVSYQKAFLMADVSYTMKLTVPSYEKTVVLKYMGQEIPIELSSETLSYEFE